MKTILLDAGHYANYNKGIITGYWESRNNWKQVQMLDEELTKRGFKVYQTRSNVEKDLALKKRGLQVKDYKADLFLSIHSDASSSEKTRGAVVIHSIFADNKQIDLARELARVIGDTMGNGVRNVYSRKGNNGNWDYYTVIHGAVDGGCKSAYILERGYHTNEQDCVWLMDDNNLRKLAVELADFLADYYGLKSKKGLDMIVNTESSNLNVRAGAGMNYSIIGKLAKGAKVYVYDIKDGWAEIEYGIRLGYVSSKYLAQKPPSDSVSKPIPKDYPTIRKGDKGQAVKELQGILNSKGFNCGAVDGIFGTKTLNAVKAFQKANNLVVDGIVGVKTWTKLLSK